MSEFPEGDEFACEGYSDSQLSAGVVSTALSESDGDKRKAVELVEKWLTIFNTGAKGSNDLISSIRALYTYDKATIGMITDLPSASDAGIVFQHSKYLDDSLKSLCSELKAQGLLSVDYVVPFLGDLEMSVLDKFMELRPSVDGVRAKDAFSALHSAKISEETNLDVERSNLDKVTGRNRVPK